MRHMRFHRPTTRTDRAEQFARATESGGDLSGFPEDVRKDVHLVRMLAPADAPGESFRADLRERVLRIAANPQQSAPVHAAPTPPVEDAPMAGGRAVVVEDDQLGRIRMADVEGIDPARAQQVANRLAALAQHHHTHP